MRGQWIISILTILLCMGLVVIIMGQSQALTNLESSDEKVQVRLKTLDERIAHYELFKSSLEKLVSQGSKAMEELEPAVAKLGPEMEKKKAESDACQTEKKTKTDELAETEKAHAETEASLKSDSDAWNQEIDSLKAQVTGHRPICDYLKAGTVAVKLCSYSTTSIPALTSIHQ